MAEAEPTSSLTYANIYGAVEARFPSLTTDEAKAIVDAAYLEFLRARQWTFLYPVTTIDVEADDETNDLPYDFGHIVMHFSYGSGTGYYILGETSTRRILEWKASSNLSSYPKHYAIEPKAAALTGQRWQVRWYPVPSADTTFTYSYLLIPVAMTVDGNYPMGSAYDSLTIRNMALAEAEMDIGHVAGPYQKRAQESLAASIEFDERRTSGIVLQPQHQAQDEGSDRILHVGPYT